MRDKEERRSAPRGLHTGPERARAEASATAQRAKGLRRGSTGSHLGVRLHRPLSVGAPDWIGPVPRYTYRRLTKLPTTAEDLRRHTVLNFPGMLQGLSFEHMVMQPGAVIPVAAEDEASILVFTLTGRGVMLLDGDRIEVSANDLVHIPAGVPYGMQTLGRTDWVYVMLQAPTV